MKADRLAEIREWITDKPRGYPPSPQHWRDIEWLLERIAALERLVPEANLLMRILRPDRTIADAKQIFLLSETIREYREGK